LCVDACHEGAIAVIDGKAFLVRDDYCDGLGRCLPVCPSGAIGFEEREAAAFNKDAADKNSAHKKGMGKEPHPACAGNTSANNGCCGLMSRAVKHNPSVRKTPASNTPSELHQWPVQIRLSPVNAPCFDDADLLIAADCCAYAYGDFHQQYMKDRITLIGCPKLDNIDYTEKLSAIIADNNIKSVTAARMEVPCCSGIANAVIDAVKASGKAIPANVSVLKISI